MARLLSQELLQSCRQQKHCVEVLWSKDLKSTLLSHSVETFKKYFLDGKVGKAGFYICPVKNIHILYKCNKKEEKPCLMSLLYEAGGLQVVVKVGGLRCSSNLSSTSVLDAGGSTPCPGRFTPGKRLYLVPNLEAK